MSRKMSKLDVTKKHYSKLKAMSKITNIPSEIRNFFSEKRRSIVMDTFTRLLEGLNLDNRSLGGLKRENCQLTNLQVFQILLLLPFFAIKGFSHYDGSALCRMFGGKKDILYSYLSQDNVNWRNVVYRITNWLLTKVTVRQDHNMVKNAISNKIHSRRYHCHYAEIEVVLGKRSVKLFFCKRGKKEAWKVLLTTDLSLRFMRAYEIYSMRWSIEVFFSDSKRLLGLADCSSRDFSAHIAHVSLVMIRYNMLASIKRALDYDTIGGLFGDMYLGVHELTVVEKIWAIIIEVVAVVSELIGADSDELTIQIIENDKRLAALREYAQTA